LNLVERHWLRADVAGEDMGIHAQSVKCRLN
jgi:hypothetical protein